MPWKIREEKSRFITIFDMPQKIVMKITNFIHNSMEMTEEQEIKLFVEKISTKSFSSNKYHDIGVTRHKSVVDEVKKAAKSHNLVAKIIIKYEKGIRKKYVIQVIAN